MLCCAAALAGSSLFRRTLDEQTWSSASRPVVLCNGKSQRVERDHSQACVDLFEKADMNQYWHFKQLENPFDKLFLAAECGWAITEVLPDIEAVATTNLCQVDDKFLQFAPDTAPKVDKGKTCEFGKVVVREQAWNTFPKTGSSESVELPPYKFCKNFPLAQSIPNQDWQDGLTVMLAEDWANKNIGHASRSMLFLAECIRRSVAGILPPIQRVFIYDKDWFKTYHPHRMAGLEALQLYHEKRTGRRFELLHPGRPNWSSKVSRCAPVVVQKLRQWTGTPQTANTYREAAYAYCNVTIPTNPDKVLIEKHGGNTRQYANEKQLEELIMRREFAQGTELVTRSLEKATYCEQVKLFASLKLFVAQHGAAVAGNGMFVSNRGVVNELSPQYTWIYEYEKWPIQYMPAVGDGGNMFWAQATGVNYVGSRSLTFSDWGSPDKVKGDWRKRTNPLIVNVSRYEEALDRIEEFF